EAARGGLPALARAPGAGTGRRRLYSVRVSGGRPFPPPHRFLHGGGSTVLGGPRHRRRPSLVHGADPPGAHRGPAPPARGPSSRGGRGGGVHGRPRPQIADRASF